MNKPLSERDYFSDLSVLLNPYEYFEEMAKKGPVCKMPPHDALLVTGFQEAVEVLRNPADFSSVNATVGAAWPLPFTADGGDISDLIESHRDDIPGGDLIVTYDDKRHASLRAIVNRLFTPTRLKANEQFMTDYSNQLVKQAVANGHCEIVNQIATPYVTLVVADLLGVPAEDREKFREVIDAAPPPGNMEDQERPTQGGPLEFMAGFFVQYLQDRRANPRDDVLNELAHATYPDGTLPDLMEMVRMATFMFGAGQDTSAKLLSNAMKYVTEMPDLQQQLRDDYSRIGPFLEEVLRLEGTTKITSRLARRDTKIGDTPVPAGTPILVSLAAANRDPRRWENPNELIIGRPRIIEHLGFGRGPHTCVGAPLARAEIKVILEKFFDYTSHIALSDAHHGPAGERTLRYEPSFIIRGLAELHLDLTPA